MGGPQKHILSTKGFEERFKGYQQLLRAIRGSYGSYFEGMFGGAPSLGCYET